MLPTQLLGTEARSGFVVTKLCTFFEACSFEPNEEFGKLPAATTVAAERKMRWLSPALKGHASTRRADGV
jgi:hypothetical protein